ncbi:hypothetical protein [Treponema sp.]|uniref:hypothetical protein n=1 Tax=Treponema sp. TaxID=166 RepID=UPI0025CF6949|nr:hypothetical protein [Treponema sp.]MCR5217546.1 hypothetical protein [Treponema sp.]
MKKLPLIFLFLILSTAAFAGPFGLNMGMTLEEVTAACKEEPEYIADDRYYIQPLKSHPLFDGYVVWVNETQGLYYIKGVSKEINTNDYGTEIKLEFSKILSPLERKYGKFKMINKLSNDTIWKDDKYWMNALADGARTYRADWEATEDTMNNFDGLIAISLGINTKASYITNKAYIWIEYGFINSADGFSSLDDVL